MLEADGLYLVHHDPVGQCADVEVCCICLCLGVLLRRGCADPLSLFLLNELPQNEHLPLQVIPSHSLLVLNKNLRAAIPLTFGGLI